MLNFFSKIIKQLENSQTSFSLWLIAFLSIISTRVLMENWLGGLINNTGDYFFHHVAYTFVFFFMSYIIFVFVLMKNLKTNIKETSSVMLWGYLIIIFPPIIDFFLLRGKTYLSFYGIYGLAEMPRRFLTFFGDSPDFGVTYGVRIEIALTVIFLFIYGYIKTKRKMRALLLSLQAYIILFVLGTFPSWVTILWEGAVKGFGKINEVQIVQLFFTPARFFSRDVGTYLNGLSIKLTVIYSLMLFVILILGAFFYYKNKFLAFIKNGRPVQLIYHGGLLMFGFSLGIIFAKVSWDINIFNILSFINVIIAVWAAWLASVVFNDIYDKEIDIISNKKRPLIVGDFSEKDYLTIGVILVGASIFYSAIVNPKVALLLVAYQALAWIYSAWPFRLKRFPGVASLISAMASLLILFAGFMLASPLEDITKLPSSIMWLILIAFMVSLPVKDLKDIAGDKKYGVKTIPVVFGEYWGKIIIGSGMFLSYFLSIIFLNEFRLTPWAILMGGISFWIVNYSGEGKKINNYNLIWWILGGVCIYGLILMKIILAK